MIDYAWEAICGLQVPRLLDVVCALRAEITEREPFTTSTRAGLPGTTAQCQLVV